MDKANRFWGVAIAVLACTCAAPAVAYVTFEPKNEAAGPLWVTIYSDSFGSMALDAACLQPGESKRFGGHYRYPERGNYYVKGELTKTPNCASQPNNAHVA